MKGWLALGFILLLWLTSCGTPAMVETGTTAALTPVLGAANAQKVVSGEVKLTAAAQAACGQQAAFNTIVGLASVVGSAFAGPGVGQAASVLSAAVGAGCTWASS